MEAGTIGTWHVSAGDSFEAGEVFAEIETDKATMGFEAQDPGVVAKILVEAGTEVKLLSLVICVCYMCLFYHLSINICILLHRSLYRSRSGPRSWLL